MERIKNYAIALFLCLVLLLQGCLKVDEENFYAFHTGEVTLTEAGVDLNATIDKKVAQNAKEFGVEYKFVYGDDDSDTWKRIACSRTLQNNDFTAHLSLSELEKNKTNQKGELLSQIKYVAYCDFSWSEEIAEERTFQITLCRLTAKSSDEGKGLVTGSGTYCKGSSATITATPKENYYFTGWSDCDSRELTRTVQVNSDTTITANFAKMSYLTVKTNNSNFGTVEGSGYYEPNTEVTITATPNYYYIEFVQWSDGNTKNPRTITVTSDVTYTATFKVGIPDAAFSVSIGKYVYFSSGNLQYHPANNEWRFAENQTDYIGDANSNCSSTYNGWLDLFGWSTSATNFGVSTSTSNGDYNGSFVDWGTNQIGSDAPNTWRTLTDDEWYYLLRTRPNASSLMGVAQVNGVNGLILLPDAWVAPAGITFKSGLHTNYVSDYSVYQSFTSEQWSKMEQSGAVFLLAAGYRVGSNVYYVQYDGKYWSATEDDGYGADDLYFTSGGANMYGSDRYSGRSVRLVKDL